LPIVVENIEVDDPLPDPFAADYGERFANRDVIRMMGKSWRA
jgi:hypothetical protein